MFPWMNIFAGAHGKIRERKYSSSLHIPKNVPSGSWMPATGTFIQKCQDIWHLHPKVRRDRLEVFYPKVRADLAHKKNAMPVFGTFIQKCQEISRVYPKVPGDVACLVLPLFGPKVPVHLAHLSKRARRLGSSTQKCQEAWRPDDHWT